MIHIIPSLEIMKAVTDKNITSSNAKIRRVAFEKVNELKSMANANVIIEGVIFDRIGQRLNADQKSAIKSLYNIDDSGKNVPDYNIVRTINFIAKREAKLDCVLILTENGPSYNLDKHRKINAIKPVDFVTKMEKFKKLYDAYTDSINLYPKVLQEYKLQIVETMVLDIFFDIPPA